MFKSIKAFFGGDDGSGGLGKRPSSFKSSSTATVSSGSGSGSGRFGSSNRSLSSTGGSSRTLGSNGNSSGTGSSGNGSGSSRQSSLNVVAFANEVGGDGHEGRRALSLNIKRHHNLVKQTPERLDRHLLNVILDQLRGGTEDVEDGMMRVPLEERKQGAARRGSASSSASANSSEFRPVAVGLTGGLPSTSVGRIAPIDGASQFGGSEFGGSTTNSTDQSVTTFGGLSFAPSSAPIMHIPDTIECPSCSIKGNKVAFPTRATRRGVCSTGLGSAGSRTKRTNKRVRGEVAE